MGIGRVPSLENVERQRLGVSAHQTSQARPVGDPNKFIPVSPVTGIGCGPSEVTNGKANESDWNGGCCDVVRCWDGYRSGSLWRVAECKRARLSTRIPGRVTPRPRRSKPP